MLPESVRVPAPCFVSPTVPNPLVITPANVESVAAVEVSMIAAADPVVIETPAEPLKTPSVTDKPLRSSVPLLTATCRAKPRPFALLRMIPPPEIVVPPVYELEPESVSVPAPNLVSVPVPLITPE